ncbi:MAG: hypothetical protein GXW93_12695 [Pseudomonas lactis]|nr:hypothetical protein [Pseudomonas lactis]
MFDILRSQVLKLFGLVGFAEAEFDSDGECQDPDNIVYLESHYASAILWPVQGSSLANLRDQASVAERLLDRKLISRESSGVVIDGYIILALSEHTEEMRTTILDIEQNTRLCRKHITWVSKGSWTRVERITSLGLTPTEEQSDVLEFPELDDAAQTLIDELSVNTPTKLARMHSQWNDK